MTILRLAWQSLTNRWLTAGLTLLAIAVSVMLLLSVEKIRSGARASFANTVSGVDLIAGARTGNIQLLLSSVFHLGNANNSMSYRSYERIAAMPDVAWTVPISLGDSHRGHRVIGTSSEIFTRYKYREDRALAFREGKPFDGLFDVVIGADVARKLNYAVGTELIIAHGTGTMITAEHSDLPFRVSGVLERTGTPLDRSLLTSLAAIEAIHINWQDGLPKQGAPKMTPALAERIIANRKPVAITAAMIGLRSPIATFKVQRAINTERREALTAALPSLTLYELWGVLGTAEQALLIVSLMVVVTSLLGMATMILATLNERRREIAILRAMGAGPGTVLGLLVSEAMLLTIAGVAAGAR
ncbi:MAG: ABC transporter permease [Pseudomonadota bacterium]